MSDRNAGVIDECRADEGSVGGMFDGKPLLILHTAGVKTGAERRSPLMCLDHEDRIYAHQADLHSNFADYAAATDRVIPVIELV